MSNKEGPSGTICKLNEKPIIILTVWYLSMIFPSIELFEDVLCSHVLTMLSKYLSSLITPDPDHEKGLVACYTFVHQFVPGA